MAVNVALYRDPSGVIVSGGVADTPVTLTSSGGNVVIDAADNPRWELELTEATTSLNNPSNLVDGQDFIIVIKQDATGSRALTFGTNWLLTDGITTAVNSTASSVTILRGHAASLPNGPGLRIYFTLEHAGEAAGTGDVTGPGSSTDTALVRFSGTTGKIIQNSTFTVSGTVIAQTTSGAVFSILGAGGAGDVSITSGGTPGATDEGSYVTLNAGIGGATSGNGGGITAICGAAGGAGVGGPFSLTTGAGIGANAGGGASFTTGVGGATGAGGAYTFTAGAGGATSGAGGGFTFTAGSANGGGVGGGFTFTAGNSAGGLGDPGGGLNLVAGNGSAGGGGSVSITTGNEATSGDGGNLNITLGTGTVNQGVILLIPKTGGTSPELRFRENQANGSNYTGIKAAASLAGSLTYTLPDAAPGASGYVLSSTTGGVMSWVATTTSEIAATVQTTDATVTTITTFATTTNNAVYMVDASFFAIDPTSGDVYERGMRAVVYRNGASVLSVANVNNYSTYAQDVSWAATITVSGTNILLQVQGDATNATEWRVVGTAKEHA